MDDLFAAVVKHGADLGIAHDGDADRCLAVDANGNFVDGDQILAILASGRKRNGTLVGNTVVATVMSNLGFNIAMKELEIEVIAAAVGDRYVLEEMRTGGFTIGGEQSGHVVLSEYATTGDGVLTALHLMSEMKANGKSMAELAAIVNRLPQVLINVPNVDKSLISKSAVSDAVANLEQELGNTGRILLRPSGTEPLIRVMVEAATADQAQKVANELADVVATHCALS
jgi:phosphoglucosamine mutase